MENKYRYKNISARSWSFIPSLLGFIRVKSEINNLQEDIDSYNTFNTPSDPMSSVIDSFNW